MKLEPSTPSRSVGIHLDEDLIDALDDLCDLMTVNGGMPSRSEIARNILWTGITIVRSPDPRAAELLNALCLDAQSAMQ